MSDLFLCTMRKTMTGPSHLEGYVAGAIVTHMRGRDRQMQALERENKRLRSALDINEIFFCVGCKELVCGMVDDCHCCEDCGKQLCCLQCGDGTAVETVYKDITPQMQERYPYHGSNDRDHGVLFCDTCKRGHCSHCCEPLTGSQTDVCAEHAVRQ